MGKFVIAVGLSGSGKSTLLAKLKQSLEGVSVVNYGRAILKVASDKNLEPDTIRMQSQETQKELRSLAAKKIFTEAKGITLIDTHCFIKTKFGFMPGIPEEILNIFHPKGLIFVKSKPDEIYHRRLRDKLRNREKQNLEEIKLQQELTQSFIAACSYFSGAPLKVVENEEGNFDQSHLEIIRFIERVKDFTSD